MKHEMKFLIKTINKVEATLSKNCFRGLRIACSGFLLMSAGWVVASFINHSAGYATIAFGILCGVMGIVVYAYGVMSKT